MTRILDREGTFKVAMNNWGIQNARETQSVALVIEFRVLSQMDGDQWIDWSEYEEHTITGWFWIIKKDGGINTVTVESLAGAIGWDADLTKIQNGPPSVACQITTAQEEWNGKISLKVKWINPEDYVPGLKTESPAEVADINARFGSQLRAAAASAKAKAPAPTGPVPPAAASGPPPVQPAPHTADTADDSDDLPF